MDLAIFTIKKSLLHEDKRRSHVHMCLMAC